MNDAIRALAGNPVADLPGPAERVRLRNRFGVSQQQVADAIKVSRRTLGTWETGKGEPTGRNRERYAELLALWQERERELTGDTKSDE